MQYLMPSAERSKESFTDYISVDLKEEKHHFFFAADTDIGNLTMTRFARGCLEDHVVYSVVIRDCKDSRSTTVTVKKVNVFFGPTFPGGPRLMRQMENRVFNHENHSAMFFLTADEAFSLLPERGVIHNIPVRVEMTSMTIAGNRVRRAPVFDFSAPNVDSTLAFRFKDGRMLYANLTLLSIHSSFFRTVSRQLNSFRKDELSGLPIMEMKTFHSDVFCGILNCLYPNVVKEPFDDSQVFGETLRLANRFQFDAILIRIENILKEDEEDSLASPCQKLIWCHEYTLPGLKNAVFLNLDTFEALEDLRNDPKFRELPKETVEEVLDKAFQVAKGSNSTDYAH